VKFLKVEWDEFTGTAWFRRASDPLSDAEAVKFCQYMDTQGCVQVRNVVLREVGDTA
jgi:pyridoxine/pyridoxamine 5'-phosphate oxidase